MQKKWMRGSALALAGMMICTAFAGCSKEKKEPGSETTAVSLQVDPAMYSADYWTSGKKGLDKVLLSAADITQVNMQTSNMVDGVVDLVTYPSELGSFTLSGYLKENVLPEGNLYGADGGMIYEAPAVTYDEEGNEIPPENASTYLADIQTNMNQDAIAATNQVSYALTLHNTTLRRFPSADRVFASPEDRTDDLFLQAPLYLGEPVVVLHTSLDQTWYYVQLRNTRGWVYWSDLVFLEKSAWVSYIETPDVVVVTDASITLTPTDPADDPLTLYMGTALPLETEVPAELYGQSTEGCYVAKVPAKDRFGNLEYRPMLIPMSQGVSHGYVPYTFENVLKLAMQLAGEKLSPRGLSYGWDDNSFFTAVYRCFGLHLPFTVEEHLRMACNDALLSDMTARERENYFNKVSPGTLLYSDNEGFLYLGEVDGVRYILHPAKTFIVDEARYSANSILITPTDLIREDGISFENAMKLGRVFGLAK
ncbi:MAG: hypothetical protein E7458_03640 [Ruminococcaceae bacterium]|nr:hypothetical protein [Oscillospiraceae bacterium]